METFEDITINGQLLDFGFYEYDGKRYVHMGMSSSDGFEFVSVKLENETDCDIVAEKLAIAAAFLSGDMEWEDF